MGTRGRWLHSERAPYIPIPIAEFLREQFVFIGLSKGVGDEEGIKILDGNEPPEVISFRLLFYYPSHENSYFFYVMLISFSVRHCRGVKYAHFYVYEVQNGKKKKKRKKAAL